MSARLCSAGVWFGRLLLTGILCLALMNCVSARDYSIKTSADYSVVVDYDRTMEEALQAGRYAWVNTEITSEHFKGIESGKGELSIVLVELPAHVTIEKVIKMQIDKNPRPGTIRELLAFAEKYPEVQLDYAIFALGSKCGLYRTEPSRAWDMIIVLPRSLKTGRLHERILQYFWPYLSSQGLKRFVNLGQPSSMKRELYNRCWACFVRID